MVSVMNKKYFYSKILLCFLVAILVLGSLFVSAEDYGAFSINLPNGYKYALKSEKKSELADIVGVSENELESYFDKGKLELLAVNGDNTSQIKLSVLEDDFSKKIVSFNNLTDDRILLLANSFFSGSYEDVTENAKVIKKQNSKYLKYSERLNDSGGEYTVTQFITVYDGKTYRFSVSYTEKQGNDFGDKVFKDFKLKEKDEISPLLKTVLIFGVLVFSALIIFAAVGIFKSYKKDESVEHSQSIQT